NRAGERLLTRVKAGPASFRSPQTKGAADRSAAPSSLERMTYFRLVIAVRSAESLAMPAAPHQFELVPNGLLPVTVVVPTTALQAPVKTLQSPFDRLVSE